ncbi:MAG: N-6 DNA methylase [Methylococcales bacterium]
MELIALGITKELIRFDEEKKNIYYPHQNKRRSYTNPEEQIQAETFLKLVLEYGYPVEHIEQFVPVKMGISNKQADIIVYKDSAHTQPYIIVECKNQDVSEQEFKKDGVDQAFSYAHALAGTTKFIWVTKGNKEEFYRFDKDKNTKSIEADIPYYGDTDAKKYKYAKGGFYNGKIKGQEAKIKTGDLKAVTEAELTRVFKQAHDALWDGGKLHPSQAFDEFDKLIFCKVWDEKNTKKGEPYTFQIIGENTDDEAKNLAALKKRIDGLYDMGKVKDPLIFNKPIDLEPEKIKTVVEYLQSINFLETDLDSKGKAFETFLGTYFRGEFGQFFTPRNVVKFAVDVLPITHNSRVLDTSCGSGGFLLYCLDKVRKQADQEYDLNIPKEAVEHYNHWHGFAEKNLFGIEINDQISRVAKMNMIIHDDGHTNVITFDGLYQIDHIAETTKNRGFKENSFDFIVTNPPFGSIVKQSQKSYMASNTSTAPYYDFSLKEVNWIDAKLKGKHTLTGRENQSTEVLFIEQCHRFLKIGGYIAIVVPDGILTNSSSQYVRDGIEEKFRIVGVVSLPQTAFTNTGAGVKSSVLFLKKHDPATTEIIRELISKLQTRLIQNKQFIETANAWEIEKQALLKPLKAKDDTTKAQRQAISDEFNEKLNALKEELEENYQTEKQKQLPDYPIFMAIAEHIGYDATGRTIPQNDLPEVTEELTRFITAIEAGQDSFFV